MMPLQARVGCSSAGDYLERGPVDSIAFDGMIRILLDLYG